MSASILIDGSSATVTGGIWASLDTRLQRVLRTLVDPDGPSGSESNWDLTLAQDAVASLGGELTAFDEVESVEGRVY